MKEIYSNEITKENKEKWGRAYSLSHDRYINDNDMYGQTYEPPESEVIKAYREINEWDWDDVEYDLTKFFNKGTFVVRGYFDTDNGKKAVAALVHNYDELSNVWAGSNRTFRLYDSNGQFHIELKHNGKIDHFVVKRLMNKGKEYAMKYAYLEHQNPQEFFNNLWETYVSCDLHYYDKVCK